MSVQAIKTPSDVKQQVSKEEWQTRVDLAAAYRLVALYGWDDLVFTHITPRCRAASISSSIPTA